MRRERAAVASLGAVVITDVIVILAGVFYAYYLYSLPPRAIVAELELVASEGLYAVAELARLAVFPVTIVFFIRWFRLSYDNSAKLWGGFPNYNPQWTLWGHFVPILNFFRPYELMREIWDITSWKWSAERTRVLGLSLPRDRVRLWWVFFLAAMIIPRLAARLSAEAATAREHLYATYGSLLIDLLDLVAAIVAIVLVRNVTRLQKPFLDRVPSVSDVSYS